jgi:lipopolysaccharide/colanic/teichoic acid biosynthesis glycosyltransferase
MPDLIQRLIAILALVPLAPLVLALGVAVRLTSPGPAFYRAVRVGPGDSRFELLKLRTMRVGGDGPAITAAGDPRVTRLGHVLRRTKLDELPQLWNVVRGEMALVGPRPEDPRYVDQGDPLHREVFSARPGMTGPTAIAFRDEEGMLEAEAWAIAAEEGAATPTPEHLERAYRERILPRKLAMDAEYVRARSWQGDLRILGRTIGLVLRRSGPT